MTTPPPRKRITQRVREQVWRKYGGTCAYCGKPVQVDDAKGYQVDHIDPVYHGGGNGVENLNPSCGGCNWWKGTRTVEEYRRFLVIRREGAPWFSREQIDWLRGQGLFDVDGWYESRERHVFAFERIEREGEEAA